MKCVHWPDFDKHSKINIQTRERRSKKMLKSQPVRGASFRFVSFLLAFYFDLVLFFFFTFLFVNIFHSVRHCLSIFLCHFNDAAERRETTTETIITSFCCVKVTSSSANWNQRLNYVIFQLISNFRLSEKEFKLFFLVTEIIHGQFRRVPIFTFVCLVVNVHVSVTFELHLFLYQLK